MKTILIVDDEYGIVEALRSLLEDEGFRVLTAPNGAQGLERAAEAPVDLVIVDVMMPILGGLEMIEQLRAREPTREVPVILISAAPEPRGSADARRYSLFLRKPFPLETLLSAIDRLLRSTAG